ncbi:hypothetical protein CRUP_016211, partial [Coryphaenoides rupestris]
EQPTNPRRLPRSSAPPTALEASSPVVTDRPFVVVWNMPTAGCEQRHGVQLNLDDFDIVNMSIFYRDHLGLYPFISRDGTEVNGGLPQNADLGAHLALAKGQIADRLRPDFTGLAVIDWEDWRPLWARNFGAKAVYRRRSKRRVRRERSELAAGGKKEVAAEARREFEEGARQVMGETLRLGVTSRPGGLWGFYGLPACYNEPKGGGRGGRGGRRGRVGGEAGWEATPVLPYARLAFTHTLDFLNETDLENTLGEAAALGAAGVVMWGELQFAKSKDHCVLLRDYLRSTLGRYVRKLRNRTQRCSQRHCSGNGRCARRHPAVGHLIPDQASGGGDGGHGGGRGSVAFSKHFLCHCYRGWAGKRCGEEL